MYKIILQTIQETDHNRQQYDGLVSSIESSIAHIHTKNSDVTPTTECIQLTSSQLEVPESFSSISFDVQLDIPESFSSISSDESL